MSDTPCASNMAASMVKHGFSVRGHRLSSLVCGFCDSRRGTYISSTNRITTSQCFHKKAGHVTRHVTNPRDMRHNHPEELQEVEVARHPNTAVPRSVQTMRDRLRKKYDIKENQRTENDLDNSVSRVPRIATCSSHQQDIPVEEIENDFFGIFCEESIGIRIHEEDDHKQSSGLISKEPRMAKHTSKSTTEKFSHILQRKKRAELVVDMPFGTLRMDQNNVITSHGNVQPIKPRGDTAGKDNLNNTPAQSPGTNYFDEQYFGPQVVSEMDNQISEKPTKRADDFSFIDEHYFSGQPNNQESDCNTQGLESSEELSNVKTPSDKILYSTDKEEYASFHQKHMPDIKESLRDASHDSQNILEVDFTGKTDREKKRKSLRDTEVVQANVFDEQYFSREDQNDESMQTGGISNAKHSEPSNIFDDEYLGTSGNHTSLIIPRHSHRGFTGIDTEITLNQADSTNPQKDRLVQRPPEERIPVSHRNTTDGEIIGSERDDVFQETVDDLHVGGPTKQQLRQKNKPKANIENPTTAYDLAMKIRRERQDHEEKRVASKAIPKKTKWSGATDSKGFRKLKDQVLDIQNMSEGVVVRILRDSVLYENDDFIAIDKPYGLPSHGGPGIHHSIGKLATPLAHLMRTDRLDIVHRLDKESTGVMLLAKTQAMLWKLQNMFKDRNVLKRYWVITKGVPDPLQGTVDIPMVETEVEGRYRMNVMPYRSEETRLIIKKHQKDLPRKDAVTNYQVLDSNYGAALVECEPSTGVKHQIRCHLAFALNTPVLGDHKYSHYSRLAPQRLPPEMLQRLGLRQALVRYVPMHLHAKALVLPQLYDGRNVFIDSRLPAHFVQNMKWLKLKPPKGK